jgi:predicted XRE-type DNA-binding protein
MRNALKNDSTHVTPSSGNVFEDLGFPPEKALALKFRARVLAAILDEIDRKKYRQKQLVELLDEHQPVVSNLLHGKISQMSLEKLLVYADRLGLKLDIYRVRSGRRSPGVTRTGQRTSVWNRVTGRKAGGKIGGKRA